MNRSLYFARYIICTISFIGVFASYGQPSPLAIPEPSFNYPPTYAKPWTRWHWINGSVSKPGITADLEAMQQAGIGGAYLMPVKDTAGAVATQPAVQPLTPEWWRMVNFAQQEAGRLQLQLGMHVSDAFALAVNPWITPDKAGQQLVWIKEYVKGGTGKTLQLEQPETRAAYYKDIAIFAYPANSRQAFSDTLQIPSVTTSNAARASFLCFDTGNKQSFTSDTDCWIQYKYREAFTCRSIRICTGAKNYQVQGLLVQAGDDGVYFNTIARLEPPGHGSQEADETYTHSIPATTAKYFRLVYEQEKPAPVPAEHVAAGSKPLLVINRLYLSDEPVIQEYEAKNGAIWAPAAAATNAQIRAAEAVPLKSILNLTGSMDTAGVLHWTAPAGNWVVVRIGHTVAAHAASGVLECDKFSRAAVTLQFDNWFDKAFKKTDKSLAQQVLKIFQVDGREGGGQNWSTTFPGEFTKRRGYDPMPYLLAMTGLPIDNAAASENFLKDVRITIAELVNDIFYATLQKRAHKKGFQFGTPPVAGTDAAALMVFMHQPTP